MELDDTYSILASAEFFEICDAEQRRLLAFASERRHYRAGQLLFDHGSASDGAYIVHRGTVAVADDPTQPDHAYKAAGPGLLLGEMGLLLSRPRVAMVTAITDLDILFVPRQAFTKLMHQYPDMAGRAAERIQEELGSYLGSLDPFRRPSSAD
jgi:CRP-like cAMP-binding protein